MSLEWWQGQMMRQGQRHDRINTCCSYTEGLNLENCFWDFKSAAWKGGARSRTDELEDISYSLSSSSRTKMLIHCQYWEKIYYFLKYIILSFLELTKINYFKLSLGSHEQCSYIIRFSSSSKVSYGGRLKAVK